MNLFLVDSLFSANEMLQDASEPLLELVLKTAGLAAPLAAVVWCLSMLGRRWFTASQQSFLWMLVLLRLAMLWGPASPFSLEGWFWNIQIASTVTVGPGDSFEDVPVAPLTASPQAAAMESTPFEATAISLLDGFCFSLISAWCIGLFLIPAWNIGNYVWFAMQIRRSRCKVDARTEQLWNSCVHEAGYRRKIPVVVSQFLRQPCVMGVMFPRLLLPLDLGPLSDQQLKMLMLHELSHLRRHDLHANWVLLGVRTLYWWNPVFWLAASRYLSWRERACDATAIRKMPVDSRRDYGELLLQLADRAPHRVGWRITLPASLLSLFSLPLGPASLRSRLKAIKSLRRDQSRWQKLATYTLIAAVIVSGMTHGEETPPTKASEQAMFSTAEVSLSSHEDVQVEEELLTVVFQVGDLIKIITERGGMDESQAQKWLTSFAELTCFGPNSEKDVASQQNNSASRGSVLLSAPTNSLVFRGTRSQQQMLAQLFEACRSSGFNQITLEYRVITSQLDLAEAAGLEWDSFQSMPVAEQTTNSSDSKRSNNSAQVVRSQNHALPTVTAKISQEQLKRSLQILSKDRSTKLQLGPKLTVFHGQQALIKDISDRKFVTGYEKAEDGTVVNQLTKISKGTQIRATPVVRADNEEIQLTGGLTFTGISEVGQAEARFAGELRQVQIPQVNRSQIEFNATLLSGESMLVGILPAGETTSTTYVILTVSNLGEAW